MVSVLQIHPLAPASRPRPRFTRLFSRRPGSEAQKPAPGPRPKHADDIATMKVDLPPPAPPPIATQQEWRRRLVSGAVATPGVPFSAEPLPAAGHGTRRVESEDGDVFVLHATAMNGDCGFAAVARGVSLVRKGRAIKKRAEKERERLEGEGEEEEVSDDGSASTSVGSAGSGSAASGSAGSGSAPSSVGSGVLRMGIAKMVSAHRRRRWASVNEAEAAAANGEIDARDVRKAMGDEVRENMDWYVEASDGIVGKDRLEGIVDNCCKVGLSGFWLGSEAGVLEFVMIARALNIRLGLYCFDVKSQAVRRFEEVEVGRTGGECEIRLLFTGPATSGHFDLLMKVESTREKTVKIGLESRGDVDAMIEGDDSDAVGIVKTVVPDKVAPRDGSSAFVEELAINQFDAIEE